MPTALFVSPHLDDAAFSCGGTAARLSRLGWRVVLATVFTASVPRPRGFALACQTDKGIPAGVDYMALRRAEDEEFARIAGVSRVMWLGHPEAPHRGYGSASELFAGVRAGDGILPALEKSLAELIDWVSPSLVFAPQTLGGHVDHVQVLRALQGVTRHSRDRLLHYRDTPYAIRAPHASPDTLDTPGLTESAVDVGRDLPTKLEACEAYASQLGLQFGGAERMQESLSAFARSEGLRLSRSGPAEAYLGTPSASGTLAETLRETRRDPV